MMDGEIVRLTGLSDTSPLGTGWEEIPSGGNNYWISRSDGETFTTNIYHEIFHWTDKNKQFEQLGGQS